MVENSLTQRDISRRIRFDGKDSKNDGPKTKRQETKARSKLRHYKDRRFDRAEMELIDSHAHIDAEQFAEDRDAMLERARGAGVTTLVAIGTGPGPIRSEEHTSELQSHSDILCRLLLEKKKKPSSRTTTMKPTPSTIFASFTACRTRSADTTRIGICVRAGIPVQYWSRSCVRWRYWIE